MCVVSVFNQRAASCRFDVDGELIKQYLWCLHQLQHFVLPLLAPLRQTAAVSVLELKWSCTATSVSPHLGAWSFHGHGHELEFYFKASHLSSLCEGFHYIRILNVYIQYKSKITTLFRYPSKRTNTQEIMYFLLSWTTCTQCWYRISHWKHTNTCVIICLCVSVYELLHKGLCIVEKIHHQHPSLPMKLN